MKIAFLGKSHAFSLMPLQALSEAHQIVGLIESAPRAGAKDRPRWRVRPQMSDDPDSRRAWPSLKNISDLTGVPHLAYHGNTGALAALLRGTRADLLCIASCSQLLPEEIFTLPRYGAINLHPSLLPRYRGAFPWFWQYHDFQTEIGMTVHRLDRSEDGGPILTQDTFPIDVGTDLSTAILRGSRLGARVMTDAVGLLENGCEGTKPSSPGMFPRARTVGRQESFIDWQTWSLERVWHFLRGTYPWVDSVTPHSDLGPDIEWRIGSPEPGPCPGEPGTIVRCRFGYGVAHPEGWIRLEPVYQPALASA